MLALALTERYLKSIGEGACRVHGGGFAGTIQVFLPTGHLNGYVEIMESIFGENCVCALNIRPVGAFHFTG
jgi:galactokinase